MTKRALTATVVLVAALAAAGTPAASNGKSRIVVESFSESYVFSVDCADFGPFAFEIEVEGEVKVRGRDVFARDDGELLQTIFHIVFKETNTNSVSGRTVWLTQAAHEVWDYPSNTRTVTGKVFLGHAPGEGKWVQDTGRITMTLDTREVLFLAGPHEAFFAGGIDAVACRALASD